MLSPLLYSHYTTDYTAVVTLIPRNDEMANQSYVDDLVKSCEENILSININKTKEMVIDMGLHLTLYLEYTLSTWKHHSVAWELQ